MKDHLDNIVEFKMINKKNRQALILEVIVSWVFQVSLFFLILRQNKEVLWNTIPFPTTQVAYARLFAGLMMHVAMMSELNEGLAKMKYCVNHSFRFRHY